MKRYIVDTDVLIACLRDYRWAIEKVASIYDSGIAVAYTPVTAAEVFRGMRSKEETSTRAFLARLDCIPITQKIGEIAGEYLRTYSKSHGLEIADALIVATASVSNSILLTMNKKHYPMKDVKVEILAPS